MTEQFLNRSKVSAGFEDMAREGMPEHMRMNVQTIALLTGPRINSSLDIGVTDPLAALTNEQGVGINQRTFNGRVVADFQPIRERGLGITSDR